MVPALLIPRQKAPKTHNYKVSLDNGLTLEFASDKLLNDKEVQDVVDGMNADGTIEKMALAANKKKAATKAANEKQAAKMDKANRDLELLKSQTKNAQRKAREASTGYNIGESIIGAAKAVEANPAVKEFNRIIKMVDSNLPSGRIVEAGINALPPEAKKVVKGIRDPFTPTSLVTGTAETIGGLMSRPEKTSYEQYGVAFDPKADPVQRLAAAVNIIGTAFSVGGATRTIAKKLPSQAELKALQDALTATKGSKATRAEASKAYQDLRKLSEKQAKEDAIARAKGLAKLEKTEAEITAPAQKPKITGAAKPDPSSPTFKQANSATVETEAGYAGQPKPKDLTGFKKPSDEIRKAQAEPELKAYREKYGATAPVVPERVSLSAYIEANYKARQQGLLNAIRNSPTGAFSKALGGAGIKETKAARAKLIAELERDIASGKVNAQVAKELEDTWNKANPKGGVTPKPTPTATPGVAATQAADVAEAAKPKPKRRASATKKQAQPATTAEPATSTSATPQPGATKPPVVPTTANQGTQAEQSQAGVATAVAAAPTEAQATVTPPPIPEGAKTAAAAQGPKTAGNNASINRRRIFEGREEIESGSGTVADRTFDKNDYDYNDFQESLRRRAEQEKPAPFDKAQQEAWNYHREKLEERQAELLARTDAGDKSAATLAEVDALDKDIDIADKMGVEAGTIGSLAFSARRSNPFDYSPTNIKFKAYKANGNEKLSPEVAAKLQKLLNDEKKFSKAASEATKFTEAEAKEAAQYIIDVGKGIKKAATAQQRAQALDAFREGIRSLMNKASLGLDPMDLVTMAPRIRNLARAWVAPGSKLDDVVDGILADAEMIAKQNPKLAPVLLKPDGSLLLDREDIVRVLAGREKDGVRALRDNIDIDLEAKRFEIDTLMDDIKMTAEYRSMNPVQRGVLEVAGLTRGLQAGFDRSAMLNQGLQALSSNPRASLKAFKNMNKAAKSEQALQQVMGELRTQPYYKLAVASKLKVNATHVSSDEIGFAQGAVGRLPGANSSNRAYAAYLNTLRMEAFNDMARAIEKKGGKLTVSEADQISEFVNSLTGAGTGKLADLLTSGNKLSQNLFFFAPSYRVARGKYTLGTPLWNAIGQARKTKDTRIVKEIFKRYAATAAAYGTLYTLLELNGSKTDYNIASKNFMKVRLPGTNTYIDPTGGLLSFVKFMARATRPAPQFDKVTGEPKRGEYGEQKFSDPQPWVALGNYLGGAAGPVPAALVRAVTKKAYGKSYDYNTNEGRENMLWANAPIWIQQSRDIQNDPKLNQGQKAMLQLATLFGASIDAQEKEVPRL